jgi:hypothetical protein
MKKSQGWNKDTVKDDVILRHMNYRTASSTYIAQKSYLTPPICYERISEFRIKSLHQGNLKFKVTKIQKQEK